MDDTGFKKKYQELKRKYTVYGLLLVVLYGLIYSRFVSAAWKGYSELVLYFLVLGSSFFLVGRCMRKINEFLGGYTKEEFSEKFDLELYQPNGHVPRKDCRASHLFTKEYGFSLFNLSGSNLVVGRYRGIRFSYSDLSLSKGKFVGRRSAAFCVLEHQGSVSERIMIKDIREHWYSPRPVSGNFEERFQIACNDREGAAHVLTSDFKRSLVQVDRTVHADTDRKLMFDICLDADCVYIVLWNKDNLLNTRYQNIGELKSAAGEDICWITTFLDAFLDHSPLFPHTALRDTEG